jgi:hypothetical protein
MTTPDLVPSTALPPPAPAAVPRALLRAGGLAALVKAATYLAGFGLLAAYLVPRGFLDAQGDPSAALAFLVEHQTVLYAWYATLYLLGGAVLVGLVLAAHELLRTAAPALSRTATVFGLLWAGLLLASGMVHLVGQQAVVALAAQDPTAAASAWLPVSLVQGALGGGIELVGALWVGLVGLGLLRCRVLGRGVGVLGVATGVAGLWTVVPVAADAAGAVFGLALLAWFVWVGVQLLRVARR